MKKLTLKEFIENANIIHNKKYDYSKALYINNFTKIQILCNFCNCIFFQKPNNHLNGQGCPNCFGKIRKTTDEFIKKAINIHKDKYDYSLVNYINNSTKVKIICRKCLNIFEQVPSSHINNKFGCNKCARKNQGKLKTKSERLFIEEAIKIHNNKYIYDKVKYLGTNKKIIIICTLCKIEFLQTPANHLTGRGCYKCATKISKCEIQWLNFLNIPFTWRQKKIKLYDKTYIVDAYDPTTNTIYEFYGDFWHGNPKKYNLKEINKKTGTTFEELYNKTIKKEHQLLSHGYKIISIWESDWVNESSCL